jgi:hypothetical protein
MSIIRYWWLVVRRTFDDTGRALRSNPKRAAITVVVLLLGAVLYGYFFVGKEKALDKLLWAGLTMGAAIVVYLVVFLFRLLITPYLLYAELLGSRSDDIEQAVESYEKELDSLRAKCEAYTATLSAEKQDAEKTAMSRLEEVQALKAEVSALNRADPLKNMQRARLRQFVEGFERTMQGLRDGRADSVDSFDSLDRDAYDYVNDQFRGQTTYAVKHPRATVYTKQVHYSSTDLQKYLVLCEDRLKSLRELMGHLD